jgi:hypothetical protein
MQRRTIIDPLSATSLRVIPRFNATELSSATAFTVVHDGMTYLITNWHVAAGRDADTEKCLDKTHAAIPNLLAVRFHKKGALGQWTMVDVPLQDAEGTNAWLEHPLGRLVDVVAIPLPESLQSGIDVYPLDLALANVDILATPAMPISVIGYPLGLSTGGSWPIWKTGHIASDPDLDFEIGRPAFLIDATTREGMSGSPVVLRLDSYATSAGDQIIAGGIATRFMGIYAGRIHEDSEIGRVWRPYLITEIFAGRLIFDSVSRRISPGRNDQCPCLSGKRFKECCGSVA